MALNKIILYYGFAPVADPKAVMLWQKTLCASLNLKGRILISEHGINGTLGGDMEDLKKYCRATKEYPGFGKIDFKWSDGTGNDFPRLSVKARKELVAFTTPNEIEVAKSGILNGGKHLKPHQVNQLVEERGDDVVFFDGRNAFEAKTIGVCEACGDATKTFRNCSNLGCKDLVLLCDSCNEDPVNLECKPSHTRGRKPQEVG